MARSFKGKIVVITGAASGLGAALCKCFGIEGAIIAGLDKDTQGLTVLAKELTARGISIRTFTCDVTNEEMVNDTFSKIISEMGDLDVLINNAGVSHISQFSKTKVSVLKTVIDINLFGTIYCTHAAIHSLMKTKGMILGISSIAGFAPLCGRTGYAAAKHGMVGFLESLRTEMVSAGVKVMIVYATYIKTNIDKNNLRADGTPMGGGRITSGDEMMPDDAATSVFNAAVNEERRLFLGAQPAWDLFHSNPLQYEEIMMSLNQYVMED